MDTNIIAAGVNVPPRDRRGHVRGLRAQRLVDSINGTLQAADDPMEVAALERVRDRAARLARRAAGVRGVFR